MVSAADVFRGLLGRDVAVVSTIDHPYPSPPIHLFDGHLSLQRHFADSCLLVNWDVSNPDDRKYRYDLFTDTGLIAKNAALFHYEPHRPYALQKYERRPLTLLPDSIDVAVATVAKEARLSSSATDTLHRRASQVLDFATQASSCPSPWRYTQSLLQTYYTHLDQPLLVDLVSTRYVGFRDSSIAQQWIPWCMRHANGPLALRPLLEGGVFSRTPLRGLPTGAAPDTDALASLVEARAVIPSLEIFLWSLAVARIKHYGNDRGFLQQLSASTRIPEVAGLQLTAVNEDCRRFLRLDRDHAIPVVIDASGTRPSAAARNPAKLSRITSFGSLFALAGSVDLSHRMRRFAADPYDQEVVVFPASRSVL